MKEFKVGDKAIYKGNKEGYYGESVTIISVDKDKCGYGFHFDKDKSWWHCDSDWLAKVGDKNIDKLIFRDNATILIKDGKRYVAKCVSGDTYDREKGLLSVLAKAHGYTFNDIQEMLKSAEIQGEKSNVVKKEENKFNVGDYVYIKSIGLMYSTYKGWFDKYAPKLKNKFAYGVYLNNTNAIYKIVAVGKHEDFKDSMLYALEDPKGSIFLIDEKGIIKAKEVKRHAMIGEYVKIVEDPNNFIFNDYKKGDILKIVRADIQFFPKFTSFGFAFYKNERYKYLEDWEYVVLENYKGRE